MLRRPGRRLAGVSLAEMLIVVAILSVVAAIAIPQASSVSPYAVDATTAEVAQAIRFAQREAIRTGTIHGVIVDPASQELRVFGLPTSGATASTHPLDKREYTILFGNNAMLRGTIVSSAFKYDKKATNYISFTRDGSPGTADGSDPLKEEGLITLRHGNAERIVRVATVTGRVSF